MKISKYISIHPQGTQTILFNSANESIIILTSDLLNIYNQYSDNPDTLKKVHPTFWENLKKLKFIVPKDCNEAEELIRSWEREDENQQHFGIIINPTLNCNLRCWYCYEPHKHSEVMNEQTKASIIRLIENKTKNPMLKSLNVSFFGGEPLLYFNENVLPILKYAAEICKKKGIKLYSNFTTNGVLLTEDVINKLNELPLAKKATFQITIDGNKELHNKTRVGANKKPTYEVILHHIELALKGGNEVYIRFNYTYDNILTFYDVLDDLKARGIEKFQSTAFIKFEHVWQDSKSLPLIKPILKKLREAFEIAGFNVNTDEVHFRHTCYADSPNNIVVNYNGNIYKCTARDFTPESKEGILDETGNVILNEKFSLRMDSRFSNKECRNCVILPICNGGCSQGKIESKTRNKCYKGLTEEDKDIYIKARLKEILKAHKEKKAILP